MESSDNPASKPSQPGTPGGTNMTVLAIDDNVDFLQLIKDLLEPIGFSVHLANSPVKALEMLQRNRDKYDLIFLDYYMPHLDGGKTLEWLRKINPDLRVIICSGADELRLRQLQVQYKLDGYIHKPFRVPDALEQIRRVMALPKGGSKQPPVG